ncbi:hypothetical protein F7Q99_39130 [Streptomyces kaniharaensis]|uniref:DUF4913 domain-containing protein n=1 Tax=Streptomyces kaniharaensis TaxID=212423 RepID=A0A6N7L208_9ACTN|nr:hypothetical protein [Streptomyces kaniharaensis]MQS18009.1 hypothetical protein [Streptomyces kaniharaensis]MQS18046.1 hypothetical protein [Streptomyces kaniharaensis]
MSTDERPDLRLKPTAKVTDPAERRLVGMIDVVNRKVNDAASHVTKVDARLTTMEEIDLPGKVIEMSRILQGLAHREGTQTPLWNWSAMNAEQMYAALNHLVHWRETYWRRYFPAEYAAHMEPCWLKHGDVVHLLGALCGMWHWAHTEADASPLRQSEWLVRWKPLILKDLKSALDECRSAQQHVEPFEPDRPINLDAEQQEINGRVLAMQAREKAEQDERARAAAGSTGG